MKVSWGLCGLAPARYRSHPPSLTGQGLAACPWQATWLGSG